MDTMTPISQRLAGRLPALVLGTEEMEELPVVLVRIAERGEVGGVLERTHVRFLLHTSCVAKLARHAFRTE